MVRVLRVPPRKVSAVPAIPTQQPAAKAPTVGGGGEGLEFEAFAEGHGSGQGSMVVCRPIGRITGPVVSRYCILDTRDDGTMMMTLYTKTGDGGETALFDGTRVLKSDGRVAAYGDVDELNATLGLALAAGVGDDLSALVGHIQRDLFAVGARLADPREHIAERVEKADLGESGVRRLEDAIDKYDAEVPPLRRFLLPGGNKAASAFHLARAVCRRAERSIVALGAQRIPPRVVQYMNRLSDLLFVLARVANRRGQVVEREW